MTINSREKSFKSFYCNIFTCVYILVSKRSYKLIPAPKFTGNSVVDGVKRVGSLRTAYRIVNSSQLVWEAYQNVGYRYNYTTAANWPPPQFYRVSISNPGDVLLFSGYVAIYVRTSYLYGPQQTTGPTEAPFGLTAPYWGSQNALRGCYRWRS